VVTAEPYFAVTQPSDVVVMENAIRKGSKEQFEFIDAKYELLKRGQYTMNLEGIPAMAMDSKTPFEVYQARNAVRIARASGAMVYSSEAFGKAANYLAEAENQDGSKKVRTIAARESVQRAEDARLIAIEKQEAEHMSNERKRAQAKLDDAQRQTALAIAAEAAALQQTQAASRENDALRKQNEGLETKNEGLQTKNEDLQTKLMAELNVVLQTRVTARGLIVNMSGVLFQNGQATLLPAAREKLSKVAGILSTHKGLRIEAEGHTDSNGSDAFNQTLSEKRAENAKDYLVQQGVASSSITSRGFGEGSPIASNGTETGRQENRRVELVVSGVGLTAVKVSATN
jgi:outer membrane protein OmpA-like peptidoglycan-associated protein